MMSCNLSNDVYFHSLFELYHAKFCNTDYQTDKKIARGPPHIGAERKEDGLLVPQSKACN